MIQALIFDMDGTLVRSEEVHFSAWRRTLAPYGITSLPASDYRRYIGISNERTAADYIARYKLAIGVKELVQKKQQVYLEMIPSLSLSPGVETFLDRVKGRYRLAVASSSDCLELHRIIKHLDLTGYFSQVVGGDMVANHKPDPEIYRLATTLLKVKPHQAVAFEDSLAGVTAAKRAGIYTVAIPSPLMDPENFSPADTILDRIDLADEELLAQLAPLAGPSPDIARPRERE